MDRSTTRSGQAELSITTWGSGGVPIVALHPGIADSRIWRQCAPSWAAAGHVVVAYDRRGFGATRHRAERHDDLVDLRVVTAATNARPAVIVGNSAGGGLALNLALAHPDEVLALVLIAPAPSGYPDDDWPTSDAEAAQDSLIEAASAAGDTERVNRLEVRYWLDGTEQAEGRVAGPARDLLLEMNGRALRAEPVGEAVEHPPVWPQLRRIVVPTLVIAGEHDLSGLVQLCAEAAAALPNGTLSIIPDTAHCPSLDQPERLNDAIVEFLRALPQ